MGFNRRSKVVATGSPGFCEQLYIGDLNVFTKALAHIVDRKGGHGNGRQGLHFNTCGSDTLGKGLNMNRLLVAIKGKLDIYPPKAHVMTKGYQTTGLLRTHDPCELGDDKHITLAHLIFLDSTVNIGSNDDATSSYGRPRSTFFITDVHHFEGAVGGHMGKFGGLFHSEGLFSSVRGRTPQGKLAAG